MKTNKNIYEICEDIHSAFKTGGVVAASRVYAPHKILRPKIMSELIGTIQLIHLERIFLLPILNERNATLSVRKAK